MKPSKRIKEILELNYDPAETEGELAIDWVMSILTYLDETASQEKEEKMCPDWCGHKDICSSPKHLNFDYMRLSQS